MTVLHGSDNAVMFEGRHLPVALRIGTMLLWARDVSGIQVGQSAR